MTNDVVHKPGCDANSALMSVSEKGACNFKFRYCPRCGVGMEGQVKVMAHSVRMVGDAYPTIINFMDTAMNTYRYVLRSDIARLYLEGRKGVDDTLLMDLVDFKHGGEITLQDWAAWLPEATGYKFVLDGEIPEPKQVLTASGKPACKVCGGTGTALYVQNVADYMFQGEAPDVVEGVCGACEGSGEEIPDPPSTEDTE